MPKFSYGRALLSKGYIGSLAVVVLCTLIVSPPPAPAAIIDLEPTGGGSAVLANGSGRGVLFTADSNFSITSVGIFANLLAKPFDLFIYNGDSASSGTVAASSLNFTPTQDGSWFDVAFTFNFLSGNAYSLVWRPTDQVNGSWTASNQILLHDLKDDDGTDDTVIAPYLTLNAGRSGMDGESINNLAARFRFNAIPEPSLWLLCLISSLFLLRRTRRRRTV